MTDRITIKVTVHDLSKLRPQTLPQIRISIRKQRKMIKPFMPPSSFVFVFIFNDFQTDVHRVLNQRWIRLTNGSGLDWINERSDSLNDTTMLAKCANSLLATASSQVHDTEDIIEIESSLVCVLLLLLSIRSSHVCLRLLI
jgi:hypothetical protein